MDVLVDQGFISAARIVEINGNGLLGPVVSAWTRTAARLGADLGALLEKDVDERTGEQIYRITELGLESLQPGLDRSAGDASSERDAA